MNHIAIPAHSLMNEAEFIFGVATSSFQIEGARHSREICIWDTFFDQPRNVPVTDMGWVISPEAFTTLLVKLHQRYQLPPVYITENGAAMDDVLENGQVQDDDRTAYFHSHLNAVNTAMELGVDIRGYFAWSLMDNFEWSFGYTKRFGLVYVDYASQQRITKQSGLAYRQFLNDRRNRW